METEPLPPPATYEQVAGIIDHALLGPALTTAQVQAGLELARRYGVRAAIVRPCDIELAVRLLEGSAVVPGAVAGFPHGHANTATKLYETRDLLRRGAREIDAVVAISRLVSREFQYVQTELLQMVEECHKQGAILKVILENAYLTEELKIVACRAAERAGADFVQTCTGFAPSGYTAEDLRLMRRHAPDPMGVKAAPVATIEQLLEARQAGASRIGTPNAGEILEAWKARLAGSAGSR